MNSNLVASLSLASILVGSCSVFEPQPAASQTPPPPLSESIQHPESLTPTSPPAVRTTATRRRWPTETSPPTPTPCPIADDARNQESGRVHGSVVSYAAPYDRPLVILDFRPLGEYGLQEIIDSASRLPFWFSIRISELSLQTLSDFASVGSGSFDESAVALAFDYLFLNQAELDEVFGDDSSGDVIADAASAWDRYQAQFPRSSGYWQLSPVGFNCDLSQALVFLQYVCGPTCGAGTLHRLTRQGQTWTVTAEIVWWRA